MMHGQKNIKTFYCFNVQTIRTGTISTRKYDTL